MMAAARPEGQLQRSLSLSDLLLYGIVYMSPIAGFTVFGFVRDASQGAVVLSYVIGCVAMALTGLSYAAMAGAVPAAGSVYQYTRSSMGETLGFIAGWAILLDYILLPALMILLGGIVINSIFTQVPVAAWAIGFLVFATTVNLLGLKATTRVDIAVAAALIAVVVVFVVAALFALYAGKGAGAVTLAPLIPSSGLVVQYAVSGASIAVLSFLGFDAISTLAEEVSGGDSRAVGKATLGCLVAMGGLYIVVSWLLADLSPGVAAQETGQAAFKIIETQIPWLAVPLTVAVGLGTGIGSAIPPQAAVARVLYAMARDRQLPGPLAAVHERWHTPHVAVGFVAVLMAVVALGFVSSVDTLLSLCNFGALIAFLFVNASVIAYFRGRRGSTRRVRHLVLPAAGMAAMAYVLSGLSARALLLGGAWITLGVMYYTSLRFLLRRPAGLSLDHWNPS
jgi:amino acid transporter